MLNIAILGAGQIGSRHLQALASLKTKAHIDVYDLSKTSLLKSKERFQKKLDRISFKGEVRFHSKMSALKKSYEIAFITTMADVRRSVIEAFLKIGNTKFLILEKVLFQSIKDYEFIQDLINIEKIRAYVNFARRQYPAYHFLKDALVEQGPLEFQVKGGNWNMASNCLHMIDLFSFLAGESPILMDFSRLSPKIRNSTRRNFKEIFGSISGRTSNNNCFNIACLEDNKTPFSIEIISQGNQIIIEELVENKKILITKIFSRGNKDISSFELLYQSELSHLIVEQLLNSGNCDLTTYEDATLIHVPFIKGLLNHINKYSKYNYSKCPIT